jgi:hypothetical protein
VGHTSILQPARSEGYYVATNLATGVQIGYDWFAVRAMDDGLTVESRHTIFGANIPVQHAQFELDDDWTPRRLTVKAEQLFAVKMEFEDNQTTLSTTTSTGTKEMLLPIGRHLAVVFINGGLYFPLHIVRRFDQEQPQQFSVIPDGLGEVRRMADLVEDGQTFRVLETKISIAGLQDVLQLVVNESGDMVRYHGKSQNVLVRLEERAS